MEDVMKAIDVILAGLRVSLPPEDWHEEKVLKEKDMKTKRGCDDGKKE